MDNTNDETTEPTQSAATRKKCTRGLAFALGFLSLGFVAGIVELYFENPSHPQTTLRDDGLKFANSLEVKETKHEHFGRENINITETDVNDTNEHFSKNDGDDDPQTALRDDGNKFVNSLEVKETKHEHFGRENINIIETDVNDTNEYFSKNGDNDNDAPEVAWLMSFPNSGTSYTMRLVQSVSQKSTASNYASQSKIAMDDKGNSISVKPSYTNGPYVHNLHLGMPKAYILTKTHCFRGIVQSKQFFREGCGSGFRYGHSKKKKSKYDPVIVKKVIHLFRDPFDNIVSRFHLECNAREKKNDTHWMEKHPRNKDGFQAWCKDMNKKIKKKELRFMQEMLPKAIDDNVPCRSEFYKFVLWHNRVFDLTSELGVPIHILHYEDYHADFNATVSSIFNFLELEKSGKPHAEFYKSDYSDHYTEKHRKAVIALIKSIASKETKNQMEKYYFN